MFFDNEAMGGGGALIDDGVLASIVVSGATFASNMSIAGSGLMVNLASASLTVEFSTFWDNDASEQAAGILVGNQTAVDPVVTIASSTFTGNTIRDGRTGVAVYGALSSGTLAVTNSTFVEPGGYAGTPFALRFEVKDAGSPTFVVNSSTIVAQGGIHLMSEAQPSSGSLVVSHSILSSLGDPAVALSTIDPGEATVEWSALSGGLGAGVNAGAGNQLNVVSLGLGSLQNNGGPTLTMMPDASSPVVNAGDPAFAALTVDQRGPGFDRVVDGRVDIGAVEFRRGLAVTGAADAVVPLVGGAGILILGLLLVLFARPRFGGVRA